MRFGFELEVRGGAASVLDQLRDDGLTAHRGLHPYHCDCRDCSPTGLVDAGYIFKAQEDCTCNGEFITGILEYGTPQADRAFAGISRALLLSGADVSGNVGNHVHVDHSTVDNAGMYRLYRLFCRYQDELAEIAAAGHSRVRGYNDPMRAATALWMTTTGTRDAYAVASGSWLAWKRDTVEFRLWNATKAAWRIKTHVGLSVAMVNAAIAGADCTQHDLRCVEDVIGPYLDGPTWAGILRQRFSKGGLDVAA